MKQLRPLKWFQRHFQRRYHSIKDSGGVVQYGGSLEIQSSSHLRSYEASTVTAQKGDSLTARNGLGKEILLTKKQAKAVGAFEKRDIAVAPGDWLSIHANVRDDEYQFTNGERVKVAHFNAQGGIVLEAKRTIPHNFRQFTHGYAITAHRSQGKTVDEVVISGDRFTKELFYVAASRGRQRITIFAGDTARLRESIGFPPNGLPVWNYCAKALAPLTGRASPSVRERWSSRSHS
jgi:hypothetical protein